MHIIIKLAVPTSLLVYSIYHCKIFYKPAFNEDNDSNMSVVVVLGVALDQDGLMKELLKERCRVAVNKSKERNNLQMIATGGDPNEIGRTEAGAMGQYMMEMLRLDRKNLVLEENATTTLENAIFSLQIIKDKFKKDEEMQQEKLSEVTIFLVTSKYHLPRSVHMFRAVHKHLFDTSFQLKIEEYPSSENDLTIAAITEEEYIVHNWKKIGTICIKRDRIQDIPPLDDDDINQTLDEIRRLKTGLN